MGLNILSWYHVLEIWAHLCWCWVSLCLFFETLPVLLALASFLSSKDLHHLRAAVQRPHGCWDSVEVGKKVWHKGDGGKVCKRASRFPLLDPEPSSITVSQQACKHTCIERMWKWGHGELCGLRQHPRNTAMNHQIKHCGSFYLKDEYFIEPLEQSGRLCEIMHKHFMHACTWM